MKWEIYQTIFDNLFYELAGLFLILGAILFLRNGIFWLI